MANEVVYNWTVNDADVERALQNYIAGTMEAKAASDGMEESIQTAFDQATEGAKEAEKSTANFVKSQVDSADAAKKQESSMKRLGQVVGRNLRQFKVFGVSLGDVSDKLSGAKSNLLEFRGGMQAAAKGAGLARGAILLLGAGAIGVLLAVLGPVILALTKFQDNLDKIRVITAQATTAIDVLIDRVANAGQVIIKLVSGQLSWSEATEQVKESFDGLNQELSEAIELTGQLERAQIRLERESAILETRFSLQRAEINKLKLTAEDLTKSSSEREAAAKKAFEIENSLLNQRVDILKELAENELRNLSTDAEAAQASLSNIINDIKEGDEVLSDAELFANIRDQLGLTSSTDADAQKFLASIKEIANAQEESLGRQVELNNKLNTIRQESIRRAQEERKEVLALQKAYDDLLSQLDDRLQQAELDSLIGIEKLQKEQELAIAEIRAFEAEIKAAAARIGAELPPDFEQNIRELMQTVNEEFAKGVDEIRGNVDGLKPIDLLAGRGRDFEKAGKDAIKNFSIGVEQEIPALQKIKEDILIAFNISEADLQVIGDSISSSFGNFIDGINAATEAQITQQDRLIDAISTRIDETQRLLDIELARQAAGRANNVESIKANLEEQQQAREEAEKKRLALERKSAKQRLRQNQAEQISNYILSVTRLIANESLKGVVGIFTAISGISLLFSLIQQSRAQAAQFDVPQFRDGTDFVKGPGTGTSDSILAMLSRGERIFTAEQNRQLGGISNDDIVRLVNTGTQVEQHGINADMSAMIYKMLANKQDVDNQKAALNYKVMQEAYSSAAQASANAMIEYWKTRPVEKIHNGKVKKEWYEGGTLKRQSIS